MDAICIEAIGAASIISNICSCEFLPKLLPIPISCLNKLKQVLSVFFRLKCRLDSIPQRYFIENDSPQYLCWSEAATVIIIIMGCWNRYWLKIKACARQTQALSIKTFQPRLSRGPSSWTSMKDLGRRIDPFALSKLSSNNYIYFISRMCISCRTRIWQPLQFGGHQDSLKTHPSQKQIQWPTRGWGRGVYGLLGIGLLLMHLSIGYSLPFTC